MNGGIGNDEILGADELADDADIGRIAAHEHQRFLAGIMVGKRPFQGLVHGPLARHVPARRGGNSVMVDGILGRGHDFRMAVQSEIIVTRKIQQRSPIDFGMRAGKAVMHAEIGVFEPEFFADRALQPQLFVARQRGEIGQALVDRRGVDIAGRSAHRFDTGK